MTLLRVISGGQCGVDVAALRAAKSCGLRTGGMMPRGFRTLLGFKPEYRQMFDMLEHPSSAYLPRTESNVVAGDATLRLAANFESAGEKATWAAIVKHRKPHMDVMLSPDGQVRLSPDRFPDAVANWIREKKIVTLNVAGNSEWTAPGIEKFAEIYLGLVFAGFRQERR